MRRDPIRQKIRDRLREHDLTMREAARALGRNPAFMRRFLERGSPRALGYRDGETLAAMLGCDPGELRHPVAPRRKPYRRKPRAAALNDEAAAETARWYLPEAMLRHEGGGLVVKRVEVIPHTEPPKLRLISANPAYRPCDCLAGEAHVAGTVLWALRRA